jgi:uncharacterized repeat protein (TIGR01451 family)
VGSPGTVHCDTASLAAGATASFTLVVQVSDTAGGTTLSNTATISSATADPNTANNSATETTAVNPAADLAITKADSTDPVKVRQPLTYRLTVTNSGPSSATGVTVTDTLPSGVTFGSASASQGSCSGTSTVTCALGTLGNGASATVTITVTPTATGTLTNTASVQGTEADPNTANNTDAESTTVTTSGQALKLTVQVKPPGKGSVTSSPSGINNCTARCTATYNSGTQVTLIATPASGFIGWSGGGCQGTGTCVVTMTTADITVTATFRK